MDELAKPEALLSRGGCWFRAGSQELHVGVSGVHEPARKAHPGLRVASVDTLEGLARRLREAGAPVAWADDAEIPGRRRLHTADPFGNRIELLADGDPGSVGG
jgi:hypothetical protein